MKISFRKLADRQVLHCVRNDHSQTWVSVQAFTVRHDFMHLAAETELEWHNGFFGLIATGWNIEDFSRSSVPDCAKPTIPEDALRMEHLVGILDNSCDQAFGVFSEMLALSCTGARLVTPHVSAAQFIRIIGRYKQLVKARDELPRGASLTFSFPL